ncbi:MAG: hypothetical protein KZQ57_02055, partial [gamma proteobacterium symbiont of Lucinoma myriamae]|nr:hypothetical protein [gamma proteobacterium symbiont of Lucinoma myriamae]
MNFFELDKNLQEIVKDVIPKIVDKEFKTGDKISKDDFEQIFFRLLLKVGADEANYGIKQLNKLLVDSGAINSDENPGISITRINRPSARITVDLAKELCNLSKMDKTFISSLEKKIDCLEIQAGQIFFSVVRFGALLREDLLTIFFSLLGETPNILNGHVWYELKNEEKNINHIWNPDPLTLILLHNWYN